MGIISLLRKFSSLKNIHAALLNTCHYKNNLRFLSNKNVGSAYSIEELKDRGLLKVSGKDASHFLQGLITNDMKHLEEGSRSMYTMFLNSKGRVMYDAIIYNDSNGPVLYVECDKSAVLGLQKHLKMFKVRRKVDVEMIENIKVWVVFNPHYIKEVINGKEDPDIKIKNIEQEKIVPCQALSFPNAVEFDNKIFDSFRSNSLIYSFDPRLPVLGVRVLAHDVIDVKKLVLEKEILVENSSHLMHKDFRYMLGVGEGINELPYGKCFPLEMNCDYLHGVSFHKGCYIGQELTARTFHTGVVRKRLMPIYLDSPVKDLSNFQLDAPIELVGEKTRAVGKLRGIEKNTAIGLVRISDALSAPKLKIGHLTGYTIKPKWWPQEVPKESLLLKKE